ncbi:hypothetical protein SAMN05421676_102466 [Salinibacillus kushneri]|uniref:Uncharacterized protein n=1 Tax=Salinibacillus kushneri TaxID=237682 RepID=A0A1I0BHF8_9BACI|nr:hypothetical protein [Salinibacillus kushneri]SET05966.1 hypothetical protein SAMN05421676_102466 [Salinibacillus kushneri]
MSNVPSLYPTLKWLKRNRFKKKLALYKQVINMFMDLTLAIYLSVFGLISLIAIRDWFHSFEFFTIFEQLSYEWVFTFFIAIIIRSLIISFRNPGFYVTTTEFQLSLLPYSREKIWLYNVIETMIKTVVQLFLIHLILYIFTPVTFATTGLLFIALLCGQLLGRVIQWRLFQINGINKIWIPLFSIVLLIGLRTMVLFTSIPVIPVMWVGFILGFLLTIFLSMNHPLKNVDWPKVISFSDVVIWNMMVVQQMTKTSIKPSRKYQFLTKVLQGEKASRPFEYQISKITVRLWRSLFKDQLEVVIRTIGVILLLVVVFGFQGEWQLGIAIALGIFVLNQISGSMFMYQFQQPITRFIPWRVTEWFKSYYKWFVFVLIFFIIIFSGMHFLKGLSLLAILGNVVLYFLWVSFDLEMCVAPKVRRLMGIWNGNEWFFAGRMMGMVIIFFSIQNPWISVVFAVLILYTRFSRMTIIPDEITLK